MKNLLITALLLLSAALASAQHSVALNWGASTTTGVTYNVYRGTVTSGPYSQINVSPVTVLTFTDTQVSSGATYYYKVRSFDGTTESADSNIVQAVIPQAPAAPGTLTVTVK